jgi:fatty-acyl-CoA synthase
VNRVNRTELTPLAFLERSAGVHPDRLAVVDGDVRLTYAELAALVQRFARAVRAADVGPGERVAVLAPNGLVALAAQFAVPLAGAVLVAVNTRLAPPEIADVVGHSRARVLVVDASLAGSVRPVAEDLATVRRTVVVGAGPDGDAVAGLPGAVAWPAFLGSGGNGEDLPWTVEDETAPISVNYTSGTTGSPKGVVYTHRSAYLNALGEVITSRHGPGSVYLWTLPMFHCNGWCTGWAVTAVAGRHVCLPAVRGDEVWRLVREEGVTHLNGAPTVLTTIVNDPAAGPVEGGLVITTAGAPPSPTLIDQVEALGAEVVHVYGLTETYGPHTVCEPMASWEGLDAAALADRKARQGVAMLIADPIRVVDGEGRDVPRDGATVGEVVMRGNNVMAGYLDDPEATEQAFRGGWFHSGDLGVWHPDGTVDLRDRAKDIIVSGGENISTIEVERAVASHPDVLEVAVVGVPDERWGERPKAFVVARSGARPDPEAVRAHVRGRLAGYKVPDTVVVVDELPKTSTGKVQKFALRAAEWGDAQRRIRG